LNHFKKKAARVMFNPLKKIFSMQENETNTPQDQAANPTEEAAEMTADANAPTIEESGANETEALLLKQLEEAKNKYLYLFSDFENFRRNAARERGELIQTAGREIMVALLPILDDFDRAAKNGVLDDSTALIVQKLSNTLKTKGLNVMNIQPGDAFDPDKHEALAEIPAPTEATKGKIVDVIEAGYLLGERMIRCAKVVTGR
jgi:molecular chaperone GrpE